MPYYSFGDFFKACASNRADVVILHGAEDAAARDFKLRTKHEILDFICNDGLEEMRFINTKPFEKNRDKQNPMMVDAYEFRSGGINGYIAIMNNSKLKKWIIKSFKQTSNRNLAMKSALNKAGFCDGDES